MTRHTQKGFTLIELMVVIVIIGVLAAMAVPNYLDNSDRAKVVEGINLIAPIKSAISEAYIANGKMPGTGVMAHNTFSQLVGVNRDPSSYRTDLVQQILVIRMSDTQAGILILYDHTGFGPGVTGTSNTLVFTATGTANGITWSCKGNGASMLDKYKPANCRGT